jgi:tetratricopeptide (TPR) repeat protein
MSVEFAITTAQALNERSPITTNTLSELEAFVKQPFPSPNAVALARKSSEYNTQGSHLWNAATKILRDHDNGEGSGPKVDSSRFGVLLRAFAYFLLDVAHNTSSRRAKDSDQTVRIFKIALKASRCSLDNNDLDLAFKLLETCSKYISAWDEATPVIRVADSERNNEDILISRLTSEFYLYRMVHASKTGRLDLAEHFFVKSDIASRRRLEGLLETAADLCYEIGRSQQHQKRDESALSWLERAYQLINDDDADSSSLENEDLRLAVVASFIECLTGKPSTENTQRAWSLLTSLEQDHGLGNRMAVLTMQLNILMEADDIDVPAASAAVFRMIRSSVLTDQTYRTQVTQTPYMDDLPLIPSQNHAFDLQTQES